LTLYHDHGAPRGLVLFSRFVVLSYFILITFGAIVTTYQNGMAVPDWPTSFGSFNPPGWWMSDPVREEHGHRLMGEFVGLLTAILSIWTWIKASGPDWKRLRTLAVLVFVGVCVQGVFGGLRVLEGTAQHQSAAAVLRVVHGCFAQLQLCLVVALAAMLSPKWYGWSRTSANLPARLAWVVVGAIYLQLVVGALMRHWGAGLAIPTFPAATVDGHWMPQVHSKEIDTNFTHTRAGALLVSILILTLIVRVLSSARGERRLTWITWGVLALVVNQVSLGIHVVLSGTNPKLLRLHPTFATMHVVNGALLLAASVLLALRLRRASTAPH
jgi:cytochrome c oxidase assembly protein subunit 15